MCADLFDKCLDQIDRLLIDPKVPDAWPPPLKVCPCTPCHNSTRAAQTLLRPRTAARRPLLLLTPDRSTQDRAVFVWS